MNGNDKLSRYAVVRISITRKIHICGRETFDHPSQSFMFRSKLFRENHVKFDRAGEGCSLFGFHFNGYFPSGLLDLFFYWRKDLSEISLFLLFLLFLIHLQATLCLQSLSIEFDPSAPIETAFYSSG